MELAFGGIEAMKVYFLTHVLIFLSSSNHGLHLGSICKYQKPHTLANKRNTTTSQILNSV